MVSVNTEKTYLRYGICELTGFSVCCTGHEDTTLKQARLQRRLYIVAVSIYTTVK